MSATSRLDSQPYRKVLETPPSTRDACKYARRLQVRGTPLDQKSFKNSTKAKQEGVVMNAIPRSRETRQQVRARLKPNPAEWRKQSHQRATNADGWLLISGKKRRKSGCQRHRGAAKLESDWLVCSEARCAAVQQCASGSSCTPLNGPWQTPFHWTYGPWWNFESSTLDDPPDYEDIIS
ncbi:uncharacterized protein BKA78DRAFT_292257 [Phyllosticta capitalensis]|uniref:uncharacterized protein n=1 Tax=Phyllosticta capitalensis TaxID=121624 RepID=UPI0031327EA3